MLTALIILFSADILTCHRLKAHSLRSVTVIQHEQEQDTESEAAKWNSAVTDF